MPPAAMVGAGIAVAGLGSAFIQQSAQRKAGHEAGAWAERGATAGRADINQFYGKASEGFDPWIDSGTGAQGVLADLNGLNGPEAQQTAYMKFQSDPSYRFSVEQANQALQRSSLSKSNIFSGNFMDASNRLNQGLASQQYGSYYDRLMGMSTAGRQAQTTRANLFANQGTALANIDTGQASQMGQLALGEGTSKADMYNNMFKAGVSGVGAYYGLSNPGTAGAGSAITNGANQDPGTMYGKTPQFQSYSVTQPNYFYGR
jgi:hypothetical protein